MPRWEKTGKTKDEFFEYLLDGTNLWTAGGYRLKDTTEWVVNHSDPKAYMFDSAEAAVAQHAKRVEKLPKSAVKVSDEHPVIAPARERRLKEKADLDASMRAWEAQHGQLAILEKAGVVRWVSTKDSTKDEFWELSLEGTTVTESRGKLAGGKPKREVEKYPTPERARDGAQIKMMTTMNILGFGPAR